MASPIRKSSAMIGLVLVGATAVSGCGSDDPDQRRDLYTTREDCVHDWGDEQKCEASTAQGTGGGHGMFWYGPMYRAGQYGSNLTPRAPGTVGASRPGSRAVATTNVSRGGFGSSAHSHSASGG